MSEINDGGPAFPSHGTMGEVVEAGMSLRDYFAAKAMQGRISAGWSNPSPTSIAFCEWKKEQPPDSDMSYLAFIAEASYDYADAMLKVRKP